MEIKSCIVDSNCIFKSIKFVCDYANTDTIIDVEYDTLFGMLVFYDKNYDNVYKMHNGDKLIFRNNKFEIIKK